MDKAAAGATGAQARPSVLKDLATSLHGKLSAVQWKQSALRLQQQRLERCLQLARALQVTAGSDLGSQMTAQPETELAPARKRMKLGTGTTETEQDCAVEKELEAELEGVLAAEEKLTEEKSALREQEKCIKAHLRSAMGFREKITKKQKLLKQLSETFSRHIIQEEIIVKKIEKRLWKFESNLEVLSSDISWVIAENEKCLNQLEELEEELGPIVGSREDGDAVEGVSAGKGRQLVVDGELYPSNSAKKRGKTEEERGTILELTSRSHVRGRPLPTALVPSYGRVAKQMPAASARFGPTLCLPAKEEDNFWTESHTAAERAEDRLLFVFAPEHRKWGTLRSLLRSGADPMAVDEEGRTALHLAAERGLVAVAEMLLAMGIDVDKQDTRTACTALHTAVRRGDEAMVSLLLSAGADSRATDQKRQTAVHLAAEGGHHRVLGLLLDLLTDPDATDKEGATALHLATFGIAGGALRMCPSRDHVACARLLLSAGANPGANRRVGASRTYPALWPAAEPEFVRRLLKAVPSFVEQRASREALCDAARWGRAAATEALLDAGVPVNGGGKHTVPLHAAAEQGHVDVVRVLLARGADLDVATSHVTSLCLAVEGGHVDVVRTLVKAGASVSAHCPLSRAAEAGHVSVAQLLLAKGARANEVGRKEETPLHFAALGGHLPVIKLLLKSGSHVNARDAFDDTPVHLAARNGHALAVDVMMQHGARLEERNCSQMTPLHLAAKKGHESVVRLLLRERVKLNLADANGMAPLHLAAREGHAAVVRLLLAAGADPWVETRGGRTALDLVSDLDTLQALKEVL